MADSREQGRMSTQGKKRSHTIR